MILSSGHSYNTCSHMCCYGYVEICAKPHGFAPKPTYLDITHMHDLSSTHSLTPPPTCVYTPPPQPSCHTHLNPCALTLPHPPCRTGYGALPSPTQRVSRACSPQAVVVVTATASCGTQTTRPSAGSPCLRTWPRGTNSAPATDKVKF